MLLTKMLLTEILLDVTDEEIYYVAKDAHRKATKGTLWVFLFLLLQGNFDFIGYFRLFCCPLDFHQLLKYSLLACVNSLGKIQFEAVMLERQQCFVLSDLPKHRQHSSCSPLTQCGKFLKLSRFHWFCFCFLKNRYHGINI